jgi:hypothetical protein
MKMNRNYATGTTNSATLFTGLEIECTPAQGMLTLFVVGIHETNKLDQLAKKLHCNHIYLGANHSFVAESYEQITAWETLAKELLKLGYWVTLDADIRYVETLAEMGLGEYDFFIPMISAKIPYLRQLGYNACVKIDDRDFAATNPGVWVHSLHQLTDPSKFTNWREYAQDTIIE